MSKSKAGFDAESFVAAFKREMEAALSRVFDADGQASDDGDDWGDDREAPASQASSKGSRCLFDVSVDQRALAGMTKSEARKFLSTECVDVMLNSYSQARKLAKSVGESDAEVPRGGYADCGANFDGGRVSGGCRVGISW